MAYVSKYYHELLGRLLAALTMLKFAHADVINCLLEKVCRKMPVQYNDSFSVALSHITIIYYFIIEQNHCTKRNYAEIKIVIT